MILLAARGKKEGRKLRFNIHAEYHVYLSRKWLPLRPHRGWHQTTLRVYFEAIIVQKVAVIVRGGL
jgi:hypothetical protein